MKGRFAVGLTCLLVIACLWPTGAQSTGPVETAKLHWLEEKVRGLEIAILGKASATPDRSMLAEGGFDPADHFASPVNRLYLVISGMPVLRPAPVGIYLQRAGGVLWPRCSVVLTRDDTVLTARHCIDRSGAMHEAMVYFPFEGLRSVAWDDIRIPCDEPGSNCHADIAILELARPYRFLPPARRGRFEGAGDGMRATAVGFGASNLLLGDRGLMREGQVALSPCGCDGVGDATPGQLCSRLDYSVGPGKLLQWGSFGGDSGGALFAGDGASYELIGLSTGFDRGCTDALIEGRYVDIRKKSGLKAVDDAFCDTDCVAPCASGHEILLAVELGYVVDAGMDHHSIRIDDVTTELLVNLNHETAGFQPEPAADLSLHLPPSFDAACFRYYGVESCQISNPPPGAYSIGVERKSGNPAYQLTVVAIYEE